MTGSTRRRNRGDRSERFGRWVDKADLVPPESNALLVEGVILGSS